MKLYKEYLSALEKLRKDSAITKAYFTTFNLSPEFFETYILPPLLDIDIQDNVFQYESLNKELENKKLDIKIFYDANMLQLNEQKRTIIKFTPILLTKGLFHPKVIYLENKNKKGKLFVGSGNLTLEGWGRNIEAFKIVDVEKNSNLYKQIYNFFIDVKGEKRNKKYVTYDKKCNFIYSSEDSKNLSFLESMDIENSSNLYVFSPYFSHDIDKIVNENFLKIEKINIIPDLVGSDKKIRLENRPKSEKIKFYSLINQDSSRMNHSKVWISDNKIGIGSYNFTNEALFGINFEAALVGNVENIDLDLEEIDFNEMNKAELEKEQLKPNSNFSVIFELIANWENRSFEIKQIAGNEINSFKIVLPSGVEISRENLNNLSDIQKEKIFRVLNKNKIFKIQQNDEIIYEGIIIEESTKGFREPIKVETIDELFFSFLDKEKPFSSEKLKKRDINYDNNEDEMKNSQKDTSYLNYYNLFKGFENLKNKLNEVNNEEELKKICFSNGNAITSIELVIEEYKEKKKNLFSYLLIKEFNLLVNEVNKIIEEKKYEIKKIEEIENIDLKLSKEDKNFLKAFYE